MDKFTNLNLDPSIQKSIDELGYETMSKVQQLCIEKLLSGVNLAVKSSTGSGKTAAFAIPILNNIIWDENAPQCLVIVPSRELAVQVAEDFTLLGRYKRIKTFPIFGKMPIKEQMQILKQRNHVIVSTPGRLMDLVEREAINLSKIKYLIIDEADELLKTDFFSQIKTILPKLPATTKCSLFSATYNEQTLRLAELISQDHEFVDGDNEEDLNIEELTFVSERKKTDLLKLLKLYNYPSTIVFAMTKVSVDKILELMNDKEVSATAIHSGLMQKERLQNLISFRKGKRKILVTTDLAARGLDIDGVSLIVNYDLPVNPENYTHRIGRTGRQGKHGVAINLVSSNQTKYLERIKEKTGKEFPISEFPTEIIALPEIIQAPHKLKSDKMSKELTKLFIRGGKQNKLRAVDIVGTICSIEGITSEDIGVIEIRATETNVEILNNKGSMVITAMKNKTIKGKKYRVEKAKR